MESNTSKEFLFVGTLEDGVDANNLENFGLENYNNVVLTKPKR